MNWPIWLLVVSVVALLAATATTKKLTWLLGIPVIVWFAIDVTVPTAVKWIFWALVALGLILAILMARREGIWIFGASALLVILLAAGFAAFNSADAEEDAATTTTTTLVTTTTTTLAPTTTTTTVVEVMEEPLYPEDAEIVVEFLVTQHGWVEEDLNIGALQLRSGEAGIFTSGEGAFLKEGEELLHREDLIAYLSLQRGDREAAQANRDLLQSCIQDYDLDEEVRFLAGDLGWVRIQFMAEARVVQTTFLGAGGIAEVAYNAGTRPAGDVAWYYVTNEGLVLTCATVRAGCGNGSTILEPKDPDLDVLVNPDVPDTVQGEGTTPVGGNPGEPDPPISHGVGDEDGDGNVAVGDVPPEVAEDVGDDGYCQSQCGEDGTEPPAGTEPPPPPPPPPDEGDPGEGATDPGDPNPDPPPTGGDEGVSDPDPEPDPPPDDGEPVEGPPPDCPPDICG